MHFGTLTVHITSNEEDSELGSGGASSCVSDERGGLLKPADCQQSWLQSECSHKNEMWQKVLFNNENTYCLFGNQSHTYVRRFCGEEFKPECLNLTVKHPLTIKVWGCMAASSIGRLHIVDVIVSATKYITILQKCMLPSARQLFPYPFLFQYNSAPCHHAKLVTNWKRQNNITMLDWPAQSPDLNPIKHLWHKVALEISRRHPTIKRELIESLITLWNCVATCDHLVKLVHTMPTCCRLVVKSKGWPTNY